MKKWMVVGLLSMEMAFYAQAEQSHSEGPCAKDREKLCGNIKPGDGRIMECMKANSDKLSPECKAQHDKMKDAMKGMKESCHADMEKFCTDKKNGHGEGMKCMHDHKAQLSPACQKHMEDMKGKMMEHHEDHQKM